MATNYIQRGDIIDVVAPAAGFTSGVPVAVGNMLGVPQIDGVEDDVVPCAVAGVYILPLAAGGADVAIGEKMHLITSTGEVEGGAESATSGDVNNIGVCACNGALAADTHIEVLLTPGAGAVV